MIHIVGKVDLNTGILYDNNGNIMPKQQQGLKVLMYIKLTILNLMVYRLTILYVLLQLWVGLNLLSEVAVN